MVVLSLVYGSKGFRDVNGSIERSAVTEVNVDGSGVAHLTDKSGREMSTRGTGDLFSAERVEVGLHGHSRVLYCIPVEAAAGMVDSIYQGATARLALLSEDGALEEKILSLGNSFEDSGNALKFGDGRLDVQVLLDDDSCNVNLLDQDQDEDGEEVGEEGQGVSGGSTRGRGLAAAAVLARNREIYRRAREDIRTGGGEQQRVLTENSSTLVPVNATGMATSAVRNAAPTLPPGALVMNPTSTVSPSPSASPTVGALSDDVLITVKVTTDDYPEVIEWRILDVTNDEVLMEGGYYEQPQTLFGVDIGGLSTGLYLFTIDILGMEQFTGSYTISVEDVEIASGGNFLYHDYVYFDGSECIFCLDCLKCGV